MNKNALLRARIPLWQFIASCYQNIGKSVGGGAAVLTKVINQSVENKENPAAHCVTRKMSDINKDELKKRLTTLQWHVTQEKGTERPYTGCYNKFYEKGTYTCVVCEQELFSSDTKYDSGCGWPAFNEVLDQGRIKLTKDTSHVGGNLLLLIANPDMVRTEVTCSKCGAHLGHVFNDGPKPKRKRFCINSAAINFHEAGQEKKVDS